MATSKRFLHVVLALLAALVLALAPGGAVLADSATSATYSIDLDGYFYRTQNAFLPSLTMSDLKLSNPSDIFYLGDELFIADTGNRRIVVYDIRVDTVRTVEYEGFAAPSGVHVTETGEIYVADPEAQKVFLFDKSLAYVREYTRPTDPSFASNVPFRPKRIGVDRRGSLYIVVDGFGDGIIQLDGNGGFLGFFTSNKTSITLVQKLQDFLFTPEIKARLFPRVPPVFSSLFVDESSGIVYSTSFNSQGSGLKKHNIAGKNMLGPVVDDLNPIDIVVDGTGKMYVGYEDGTIAVHSEEGRLLFFFGASAQTGDFSGIFTKLSALTVDGLGNLWALDSSKCFLQRFTPTDYALGIFTALDDYGKGDYDGSLAAWQTVLEKNEMSSLAHAGIAQVFLLRQEYAAAAREFAIAGEKQAFSVAYWEVRNAVLQRNAATWLLVLIGGLVLVSALRRILRGTKTETFIKSTARKAKGLPYLRDLLYAGHVMAHPSDAFYEIRLKRKGSLAAALTFIFLGYAAYLYDTVGRGYIFQQGRVEDENLLLISVAFFFLVALFVIGNTLVASIDEGNGRISMVLRMTGYAMVPAVLILPVGTLLTNVMTLNESYLFGIVQAAAFVWTFITLSIGVAETHEYLYRNSIKSLFLTAFFMLIALLSLAVLAILGSRLFDFVLSIVKEVIGRA